MIARGVATGTKAVLSLLSNGASMVDTTAGLAAQAQARFLMSGDLTQAQECYVFLVNILESASAACMPFQRDARAFKILGTAECGLG